MRRKLNAREAVRKLLRAPKSAPRDLAIRKTIRQIPKGKVATYSQVAAAAGYPMYHRQVAQLLRGAGLQSIARGADVGPAAGDLGRVRQQG